MAEGRRKPFGVQISEIAEELNIPKATVDRVIRKYIDNMVKEVTDGNPVAVEGLFSIKCSYDENMHLVLRGAVSQTLRDYVNDDFAEEKPMRMLRHVESK